MIQRAKKNWSSLVFVHVVVIKVTRSTASQQMNALLKWCAIAVTHTLSQSIWFLSQIIAAVNVVGSFFCFRWDTQNGLCVCISNMHVTVSRMCTGAMATTIARTADVITKRGEIDEKKIQTWLPLCLSIWHKVRHKLAYPVVTWSISVHIVFVLQIGNTTQFNHSFQLKWTQ